MGTMKVSRTATIALIVVTWFGTSSAAENCGLVAYYPFDGDLQDKTAHENHGVGQQLVPTADRFGHPGNAFAFDGPGSMIIIENDSFLNPEVVSVVVWVKFDKLVHGYGGDRAQFPVCKGGDRTAGSYRLIQRGEGLNDYDLSFKIGHYGPDSGIRANVPALQTNRWYHIAGTYDGDVARIYLDGILLGAKAIGPKQVGNSRPLYCGYNNVSGYPYYLDGSLDELRLYNRALTPAEIRHLYREKDSTRIILGDVSNNGQVSSYDAALVLKHSAGLCPLVYRHLEAANVSSEKGVGAFDASLILQYVVGKISGFPGP